jgi:hypothetical protein
MWLAGVAILTGAFYVEEDWRGQRDWNRYRKAVESRGETLDFLSLVPKPVPDEENFATTPIAQSLFQSKAPILTNDLFARADDHVFHTNNQSFLGRRHFLDLVAWKMAWTALKTGKLNAGQTFESDNMDPDARRSAALAVLDGMKPDDKAFAELQEASARPYSRFPLTYDMDDPAQMSLSHLAYIKKICQRLDLMACAELAAGKPDLALSHVKLALYLTDSVKTEPVVISYLVRVLDFQLVIQAIWEGLAEHRWAESQLQDLQKCLQQYDFIADMDQPLKGERTFGIREIEHYKKKGLGQLDDLYLLNIGDIDHLGQPTSHKTFLDLVGKIGSSGKFVFFIAKAGMTGGMEDTLLHEIFGVSKSYRSTRTEVKQGGVFVAVEPLDKLFVCPGCRSRDVIRQGKRIRRVQTLPIGFHPVFWKSRCRAANAKRASVCLRSSPLLPSLRALHPNVEPFCLWVEPGDDPQ